LYIYTEMSINNALKITKYVLLCYSFETAINAAFQQEKSRRIHKSYKRKRTSTSADGTVASEVLKSHRNLNNEEAALRRVN